jgi:hypothetical protein
MNPPATNHGMWYVAVKKYVLVPIVNNKISNPKPKHILPSGSLLGNVDFRLIVEITEVRWVVLVSLLA